MQLNICSAGAESFPCFFAGKFFGRGCSVFLYKGRFKLERAGERMFFERMPLHTMQYPAASGQGYACRLYRITQKKSKVNIPCSGYWNQTGLRVMRHSIQQDPDQG